MKTGFIDKKKLLKKCVTLFNNNIETSKWYMDQNYKLSLMAEL